MNNLAAKFQIAIDLLNNGFFCKCENWQDLAQEDGSIESQLMHESACEAHEFFFKVINSNDFNEQLEGRKNDES